MEEENNISLLLDPKHDRCVKSVQLPPQGFMMPMHLYPKGTNKNRL